MKRGLTVLFAALVVSIDALTEYAKNNVRKNFGEDRFIAIHGDEINDVVYSLLHSQDKFGHNEGHHHIKISPETVLALEEEGAKFQDLTDTFLDDMERNLQSDEFVCEEDPEICAARPSEEFFNTYHTIESLYQRYENLHIANPDNTRWEVLGNTYEGREQMLLWINDDEEKPLVYYYCAIHAREWIGPMYCAHLAESLLDPNNEQAQNLLKMYSFVITPIGNPDGYKYTHTDNSLWRKTRKPNEGVSERCTGTDPNRNWGYEWGGAGASANPCTETYRGTAPFDQNITINLKEFSDKHKDRLIHVNDVHSYGEYYLSAWAYTVDLPPAEDYAKMEATNSAMFEAIKAFSGLEFKIGPTATTIYEASGGSMDYFYGENDIIYAGSYEARGNSFQPATSNIKPSNAELFVGTYALLDKVFEIELCTDAEESNVYVNEGDAATASCGELEEFCSETVVLSRCPITCNTCSLSVIDLEGNSVFLFGSDGDGDGDGSDGDGDGDGSDGDGSDGSGSNDDDTALVVVRSFLFVALAVIGVGAAVYLRKKHKAKAAQAEVEVKATIAHYTQTL